MKNEFWCNQYTFTVCYVKRRYEVAKILYFEIASNWKKIGISNAKQAYEYALQVNQPKNYETHSNDKRQNNRGRQNQFYPKKRHLNGFKIGTIKKKIKK